MVFKRNKRTYYLCLNCSFVGGDQKNKSVPVNWIMINQEKPVDVTNLACPKCESTAVKKYSALDRLVVKAIK